MFGLLEPAVGALGLIGLGGLVALKSPPDTSRSGGRIRSFGIIGLLGLAGIWIGGVGALGAAGALGLWNHQNPKLALWGKLGWLWPLGIPYALFWAIG